jgi:hypothetical protein
MSEKNYVLGFTDAPDLDEIHINFNGFYFNEFKIMTNFKIDSNTLPNNYLDIITSNMENTFSALNIVERNILLAGEVQSGKTDNIIAATMIALDNDYDIVLIFGGTTNLLLKQFVSRVEATNIGGRGLVFYDWKKATASISLLLTEGTKIIFNSLKDKKNLDKVEEVLSTFKDRKVLIIDDECDSYSLNTSKTSKPNPVYKKISNIINMPMVNTKYIGVTATPYANIVNEKSPDVYPEAIVKLKKDNLNYTGLNFFNQGLFYDITSESKADFEFTPNNSDFYKFVAYFLIVSDFINKRFNLKTSAIINADLVTSVHKEIKNAINPCLKKILQDIEENNINQNLFQICEFLKNFDSSYSLTEVLKRKDAFDCCVLNSNPEENNDAIISERMSKANIIFVGGTLVSRGVTFNNLLTELIINIRPTSKQPIDVLLQRARWFGYRKHPTCGDHEFQEFMKIFISADGLNCFNEAVEVNEQLYYKLLNTGINLDCNLIKTVLKEKKSDLKYLTYSDKE